MSRSVCVSQALEVAGQVAGTSVSTSPLPYSTMASQCEALGTDTRKKLSNWLTQDNHCTKASDLTLVPNPAHGRISAINRVSVLPSIHPIHSFFSQSLWSYTVFSELLWCRYLVKKMIYRTVGVKSFQRNHHGYLLSCHLQALSITSSEQLVVRNAGTVHPALFSLAPNLMAYGSSSSRACKFFLLLLGQ